MSSHKYISWRDDVEEFAGRRANVYPSEYMSGMYSASWYRANKRMPRGRWLFESGPRPPVPTHKRKPKIKT